MSYDLYFARRPGSRLDEEQRFRDHFQGRPRYELNGTEAHYENPDTGVYFTFLLTTPERGDELPDTVWSLFNMNFFRPRVFALEALPEVDAFVRALDAVVFDPQGFPDDVQVTDFGPEAFLRNWNLGNRTAYHAFSKEDGSARKRAKHRELIEAVWRWNYAVQGWMDGSSEDVFIPHVRFLEEGDRVSSMIVWTDAIPVYLPVVERVLVYRTAPAIRKLLSSRPKFAHCNWSELEPHIRGLPRQHRELEYVEVTKQPPEKELLDFLRRLPELPKGAVQLAPDSILDADLFL